MLYKESISIHALREEGDRNLYCFVADFGVFLSTPSARRATDQQAEIDSYLEISIHALREEGDVKVCRLCTRSGISIHALREEGDVLEFG